MKALTAAEMQEVDRLTTERFAVPSHQLMENAGQSVAEVFLEQYAHKMTNPPGRVAVLCGKGNNGGDGFVVARHLKEEAEQVHVYLFAKPEELRGDAAKNFQRWRDLGDVTTVQSAADWDKARTDISSAEVIIDALLGTGIRGAATGLIAQAIEDVNRLSHDATAARPAWIVAVDTPSGLPSDGEAAAGPVIKAHWSVTFTAPKIGQLISPASRLLRPTRRPRHWLARGAHRGSRKGKPALGRARRICRPTPDSRRRISQRHLRPLVVAGRLPRQNRGRGFSGASCASWWRGSRHHRYARTCLASHRVHATRIHDRRTLPPQPKAPSLWKPSVPANFAQALKGITVLAIGPGVGQHPETQEFLRSVVAETDLPIVLDADGLNAFASHG